MSLRVPCQRFCMIFYLIFMNQIFNFFKTYSIYFGIRLYRVRVTIFVSPNKDALK